MVAQTVDLVNLSEVKTTSQDAVNTPSNNNQSSSTGEFEKAFDKATETFTPKEEVKETVKELPKNTQDKTETIQPKDENKTALKAEDIKFEIVKEINNETGEVSISIKEITPVDNEIKTAPKREVLDLKDLLKKAEDLVVENKNELANTEIKNDLANEQLQNQEIAKEVDLNVLQKQENVLDFVIKETTVKQNLEPVISDEAKELNQKLSILNTISDNVRQLQEKSGKPVQFISQAEPNTQVEQLVNTKAETPVDEKVLVPTDTIEPEIETPLVKVSNDLAEKKSEIVTQKDLSTLKDALAKNDLTQDKTDEMKVEIKEVKVNELASNSSNNFNNQSEQGKNFLNQNAQEQLVRLELQSNQTPKDDLSVLNNLNTINAEDPIDGLSFDLSKTTLTQNTTTTSTFSAPKTLNQADILNQINKQIDAKAFTQQGETKVSIVLRPENLGKVEIELVSTKEGLTARMTADNAQVKEILDKNLDGLKESLSSQGVNVNNVNVKVSESQKSDTMFSFDQQQKQSHEQEQNQKTKEGQFLVEEEEIDDEPIEISAQEQTIIEQTATISGLNGKVDYKI